MILETNISVFTDEITQETSWSKGFVDLSFLCGFREYIEQEDLIYDKMSIIYLSNGITFVISTPIDELSKKYEEYRKAKSLISLN
jgi:hypothetical protein